MRQIRRIDGPYQNGPKWRLRIVLLSGERRYHPEQYEMKGQADRAKKALLAGAQRESGPVTKDVIEEYRAFLAETAKNQPASIQTTIARLKGFLAGAMETPLSAISAKRAKELQVLHDIRPSRQGAPGASIARETRRGTLGEVKTFMRWAAERGYASLAAFEELKLDATRGRKEKRRRGKPKLRDHERIRWWAKALERAGAGDEAALAAMMCLDGNLRAGEVLHRQVRDVEGGGKRLVIDWGKTEDSDRTASFGDEVAALLAAHIKGRPGEEALIRSVGAHGPRKDRQGWLRKQCVRICSLAGVPRVTLHGLRGTGAERTLMRMVMALVQPTLGHRPGTSVTKDHYLGADAVAEAERLLARATLAGPT
jgi:integrase